MSRRSGRTTRMLQQLPETGAIVVVPSVAHAARMERDIFNIRGSTVCLVTKVAVVSGSPDLHQLRGVSLPIFVDHSVADNVDSYTLDRVRFLQATAGFVLAHNQGLKPRDRVQLPVGISSVGLWSSQGAERGGGAPVKHRKKQRHKQPSLRRLKALFRAGKPIDETMGLERPEFLEWLAAQPLNPNHLHQSVQKMVG